MTETKAPAAGTAASFFRSRVWVWGLLILILLAVAAIRFRLREMPLERDEGEYAYAGQLILRGIPPYQLAYNMKFPGTYVAYALILAVFGQTTTGIHLGFLLINAAAIVLVYWLATRLTANRATGLVAASSYAFLTLGEGLLGLAAHATHFVILPALGGCLLLLNGVERQRLSSLFWSGVLFGLATLMKQNGGFFVLFAGAYLIFVHITTRPVNWKRLGGGGLALALGVMTPLLLTGLWLWYAGVFSKFWFWTISYAQIYATATRVTQDNFFAVVRGISRTFFRSTPDVIWAALGLALPGLLIVWKYFNRQVAGFVTGLLVFSLLAICPGFVFRDHYYVLLLPALTVLGGVVIVHTPKVCFRRGAPWVARGLLVLYVMALVFGVFREQMLFFRYTPAQACRYLFGMNPFLESVEIAEYLKHHAAPDARIAVIGSEPQIYFYTQRLSATGYIYTYALMEAQPFALQMQKEMIHEIETNRPDYLVTVLIPTSWLYRRGPSSRTILEWCNRYAAANYTLVGMVNLETGNRTDYFWDEGVKQAPPPGPLSLMVFKRNDLP